MVTEYIDGGDLRGLLQQYATTRHPHGYDRPKLHIASQIAQALTYLHSRAPPVVHRHLKSKNALLTTSLDAKLIDFGVSTERQAVTMMAGVGTSLWMAPEVMLGNSYNEKANLFSFGVILSELDTHELPYEYARETMSHQRMSDLVLLQKVSKKQLTPQFTKAVHPEILALARECLDPDATLRPPASTVAFRLYVSLKIFERTSQTTNSRSDYERISQKQTRLINERSMPAIETRATTQYKSNVGTTSQRKRQPHSCGPTSNAILKEELIAMCLEWRQE